MSPCVFLQTGEALGIPLGQFVGVDEPLLPAHEMATRYCFIDYDREIDL